MTRPGTPLPRLRRRNGDFVDSLTLASVNCGHRSLWLPVAPGLHKNRFMLDPLAAKIEHYMDLLSARQKLVASNIANADTPGYKTKDIDFQTEFLNATSGTPAAVEVSGLAVRNDGNNVSIDREARLLSENALRFSIASALMRDQIKSVKQAIEEGKSA